MTAREGLSCGCRAAPASNRGRRGVQVPSGAPGRVTWSSLESKRLWGINYEQKRGPWGPAFHHERGHLRGTLQRTASGSKKHSEVLLDTGVVLPWRILTASWHECFEPLNWWDGLILGLVDVSFPGSKTVTVFSGILAYLFFSCFSLNPLPTTHTHPSFRSNGLYCF